MWICTKLGFYSIVFKPTEGWHIRARVRGDLESLLKAINRPDLEILKSWPGSDYPWRMILSEPDLQLVMQALTKSIDYGNFKGQIARTPDQSGKLPVYSKFHDATIKWEATS